jgi:hypothetical protein
VFGRLRQVFIYALNAIAVGAFKNLGLVWLLKTALTKVFFEGEPLKIGTRVICALARRFIRV